MKRTLFATGIILIGIAGMAVHAEQTKTQPPATSEMPAEGQVLVPKIRRTDISRRDLEIPGYEAIQVRVDFSRDAAFGNHFHPGAEIAFVLEGVLEYELDGQPPVTLQAGEALFIPAGTIHSAKNVGPGEASELATYIVQRDKPLVTIAE